MLDELAVWQIQPSASIYTSKKLPESVLRNDQSKNSASNVMSTKIIQFLSAVLRIFEEHRKSQLLARASTW